MPDSLTEYAHRIGRTARIDHPGRSVIVLFEKVKFLIKEVKFLDKLNQTSLVELKTYTVFDRFKKNYQKMFVEAKKPEQYIQSVVRQVIAMDNDSYYKARRAYNSYCRAYAFNKDKSFNLKNLNLFGLVNMIN